MYTPTSRVRPPIRLLGALLSTVLLLGVALAAGVYLFLPLLFESLVAESLRDQYATSTPPQVDLYRDPASFLSRDYDGGRVILTDAYFGGVRPDRVTVELEPFEVDLPQSATSRRISTQQPISGALRAELSESEVARVAQEGTSGGSFPVLGVDLEEGRMTARSEAEVLGQDVPVYLAGDASVQNGALAFEPEQVMALGVEVQGQLTDQLLQGISFVYPIEDLPPGVEVAGVEAEEDRLILTGQVDGLRL